MSIQINDTMNTKKLDWHLFWAAAGVVLVLATVIIGCYISLKTELNTIKTVLILKGIMPKELVANYTAE